MCSKSHKEHRGAKIHIFACMLSLKEIGGIDKYILGYITLHPLYFSHFAHRPAYFWKLPINFIPFHFCCNSSVKQYLSCSEQVHIVLNNKINFLICIQTIAMIVLYVSLFVVQCL